MIFHGGLCGLSVHEGEYITTEIGWGVGEKK